MGPGDKRPRPKSETDAPAMSRRGLQKLRATTMSLKRCTHETSWMHLNASSRRDRSHRRERGVAELERALVFLAHELRLELHGGEHVAREEERGGDLSFVERRVRVARRDGLLLLEGDRRAFEEHPRDGGLGHHLEEAIRVER